MMWNVRADVIYEISSHGVSGQALAPVGLVNAKGFSGLPLLWANAADYMFGHARSSTACIRKIGIRRGSQGMVRRGCLAWTRKSHGLLQLVVRFL